MKYQVKPFEVPRRNRSRQEIASATPKSLPAFAVEANSLEAARAAVRERYRQQGRTVRSLNAVADGQLVVYVESK